MTQSTESQANRDECVFPCRFSIWQVQTLGLLRDTSILMWPYSPRPVHSQCGGWLSLDIIMAKLADAADLKPAPPGAH